MALELVNMFVLVMKFGKMMDMLMFFGARFSCRVSANLRRLNLVVV